MVARLPALHGRLGVAPTTRAGGVLAAIGVTGWALAASPWQLFAATALSGAGWAMASADAINAMVSPWFVHRRPAALSAAYNGASVGGILLSPLWVASIGAFGFPLAASLIGAAMATTLWVLAGRYFAQGPAAFGQVPDGEVAEANPAARTIPFHAPLPGGALWRNQRFATLALGTALGLFAQIGLIAQADFAAVDTARVVARVTAMSQAAYALAPAAFGMLRAMDTSLLFLAAAILQAAAAVTFLSGRGR